MEGGRGLVQARVTEMENISSQSTIASRTKPKRSLVSRGLHSYLIALLLGPLFGVFIFYYTTYLVLDGSPIPNHSATNLTDENKDWLGPTIEKSALLDNTQSHIIGGSVGAGAGVLLTFGGLASRRVRCSMLLVIPSLFAKRGRAFMISTAAGFLLSGPLATIDHNIQQVVDSFICLYESMADIAEKYVDGVQKMMQEYKNQTDALLKNIENVMASVEEKVKEQMVEIKNKVKSATDIISKPVGALGKACGFFVSFFRKGKRNDSCGFNSILPDIEFGGPLETLKDFSRKLRPDVNVMDIDLEGLCSDLEYNSISNIQSRLKNILKSAFDTIRFYAHYAGKLLYLSIILVFWDAYSYMRNFYSDDLFDNMIVDDHLRDLWLYGDKENILPLRKWELTKYQYCTAVKLSKAEAKRTITQAIPTVVFSVVALSVIAFDVLLSTLLQVFRDNAKFGISYEGMAGGISLESSFAETHNMSLASLNLQGFNLTSEPCLPQPMITSNVASVTIITLTILALLSCIVDAFASRLRARICNLVFKARATERAEFLYKHIAAGRRSRRIHFQIMVCREVDILDRKTEFSICCTRLTRLLRAWVRKTEMCPSCKTSFKSTDGKVWQIIHKNEPKDVLICEECYNDVE